MYSGSGGSGMSFWVAKRADVLRLRLNKHADRESVQKWQTTSQQRVLCYCDVTYTRYFCRARWWKKFEISTKKHEKKKRNGTSAYGNFIRINYSAVSDARPTKTLRHVQWYTARRQIWSVNNICHAERRLHWFSHITEVNIVSLLLLSTWNGKLTLLVSRPVRKN